MNRFVADGPRRLRDAQWQEYDARLWAEMQALRDAYRAQLQTATLLTRVRLWFGLRHAEGRVRRALDDEYAAEGRFLEREGSFWRDPDIDRRLFVARTPKR